MNNSNALSYADYISKLLPAATVNVIKNPISGRHSNYYIITVKFGQYTEVILQYQHHVDEFIEVLESAEKTRKEEIELAPWLNDLKAALPKATWNFESGGLSITLPHGELYFHNSVMVDDGKKYDDAKKYIEGIVMGVKACMN